MKKLLVLIGILSSLTGFSINVDKVQDILLDNDLTYAQRAEVINYMTDELEDVYHQIITDDIRF